MTKIYLVRHGETFFNVENRLGGDPYLTTTGESHGDAAAEWLSQYDVKQIFTSTKKRAVKTGEKIHFYFPQTQFIQTPALDEINYGFLENKLYSEFKEEHRTLYEARESDKYNFQFPSGESYKMVERRVTPLLDEIIESDLETVIVSHQGTSRVIIGQFMNMTPAYAADLRIPNEVLYIFDTVSGEISHVLNKTIVSGIYIRPEKP